MYTGGATHTAQNAHGVNGVDVILHQDREHTVIMHGAHPASPGLLHADTSDPHHLAPLHDEAHGTEGDGGLEPLERSLLVDSSLHKDTQHIAMMHRHAQTGPSDGVTSSATIQEVNGGKGDARATDERLAQLLEFGEGLEVEDGTSLTDVEDEPGMLSAGMVYAR